MRQRRVIPEDIHRLLQRNPKHAPDGQRGHQNLRVVCPLQLALGEVHQWALPTRHPAHDQAAIQRNVSSTVARAEVDDLGWYFDAKRSDLRQRLALDDSPVKRLLVCEYPCLGLHVLRHAPVVVHVIRRDVRHHGDRWAEKLCQLELERVDRKD